MKFSVPCVAKLCNLFSFFFFSFEKSFHEGQRKKMESPLLLSRSFAIFLPSRAFRYNCNCYPPCPPSFKLHFQRHSEDVPPQVRYFLSSSRKIFHRRYRSPRHSPPPPFISKAIWNIPGWKKFPINSWQRIWVTVSSNLPFLRLRASSDEFLQFLHSLEHDFWRKNDNGRKEKQISPGMIPSRKNLDHCATTAALLRDVNTPLKRKDQIP